jgi:hypothetical protein
MSCPTCDHSMACVGDFLFHCERCGTLRNDRLNYTVAPKLVERCRQFGETLGPAWGALWHRLGIEESIALPHERKIP